MLKKYAHIMVGSRVFRRVACFYFLVWEKITKKEYYYDDCWDSIDLCVPKN